MTTPMPEGLPDIVTNGDIDYEKVSAYLAAESNRLDSYVAAAQNAEALKAKAQLAIVTNTDFLDIASPTNAQVLAQVRALTRETTALIRLLTKALDSTDGT